MFHITVTHNNKTTSIEYNPADKKSLSILLEEHGIILNTSCGGHNVCGKCLVYINDSLLPVKACSYYPEGNIGIRIPDTSLLPHSVAAIRNAHSISDKKNISCAIDIGSTSITVCVLEGSDIVAEDTFFNSTRQAGADVISRIQKANDGHLEHLSTLLKNDITNSVARLITRCHIEPGHINTITISCNSTMQHLLFGMNCSGMSSYPFIPYCTQFDNITFSDIIAEDSIQYEFMKGCNCPVTIIPSFSAFIGGDIISGLYSLNEGNNNEPYILLDLGTNAEMVLSTGNTFLCTSAAAGPAFEASGLSHGSPCVAGAINNITLRQKSDGSYSVNYTTIAGRNPIGICGSGILSLLSEMLHNGIIDSYGTFIPEYNEGILIAHTPSSRIIVSQDDIRKLQLAIAAIRTGILLLIKHSGLAIKEIKKIYISGSFGTSLDMHKLGNLKILPEEWLDGNHSIFYAGNTSLNGAIKISSLSSSTNDKALPDINTFNTIIEQCSELELSNLPEFNDTFINNINF